MCLMQVIGRALIEPIEGDAATVHDGAVRRIGNDMPRHRAVSLEVNAASPTIQEAANHQPPHCGHGRRLHPGRPGADSVHRQCIPIMRRPRASSYTAKSAPALRARITNLERKHRLDQPRCK